MSLTLSLNNALSGLRANQQAISVLSQNISNANTEGYSRQIVEQSAQYIAGTGVGVRIDDVVRKVDKYLQRAVQTQGSALSRSTVVDDYYQRINVLMGQPGSGNTLDANMTSFFTSLQSLAETPDRTSTRSDVVASAQRLAGNFSGTASSLEDLRFEADREIAESVDTMNALMKKLVSLNNALTSEGSLGHSTAGLLDQRDATLREMSSYMNISTTVGQYGEVSVIAGDGVALVDGSPHEIRYISSQSSDQFVVNGALNALEVVSLDPNGNVIGAPQDLISGGTTGNITSELTGGKIEGLRLMRDEVLPAMLDQLDMLSAGLRDAVNAIHNDGSGFPPAASLTGTRSVQASEQYNWSGNVRIAVLTKNGQPIPAGYNDESGMRPLTLNLAQLNSGNGKGSLTMQNIVDEINQYYGPPLAKAELGNINSIKLVSDTTSLSLGVASNFSFDFELENISGANQIYSVGGVTVRDAGGVDITNVVAPPAQVLLDPLDAYYTSAGLTDVTLNLLPPQNVQVGDLIYLGPPGTPTVNGIPAADLTGYFEVQSVGGNSITINARSAAATTGDVADASGVYIQSPTNNTIPAGQTVRTDPIQVNLGGNPNSAYYDITVSIATFDENGAMKTSNITYRVQNGQSSLMGDRYGASAVTDDGLQVLPNTAQEAMRAILVDENGREIPKDSTGKYLDYSPSYLKLFSNNPDYVIALDEMDSQQLGIPEQGQAGTNWGFSHYFGLNDFFEANNPTATGDAVTNSAINLRVAQRLVDNPNLITSGDLVLQRQPTNSSDAPLYTYVRYSGDNQLATRLTSLATQNLSFGAAGGLPAITLTIGNYTSQLLGNFASNSTAASGEVDNAQVLYDGFKTRADAISGVNLDEELANTVIFQNSYSATARVITVVDKMFEDLLGLF